MCSLLLAGVCMLSTSHVIRQKADADYSIAINLADAGVDYELNYITSHGAAHLQGSPYSGSIPGVPGSFSVYVQNRDGSANWVAPNPMTIVSSGTLGRSSRTITCDCGQGAAQSLFGANYAVFGYNNVNFTGALSTIVGNLGTNGTITSDNNGLLSISGGITLAGITARLINTNLNVSITNLPAYVPYPPVDVIVNASFPHGWSDLTSSAAIANQTARMRTFSLGVPVLSTLLTKQVSWTSKSTLSDSDIASLGLGTLILTPGDYYFSNVNITGLSAIVIDSLALTVPNGTPGPVRIWINNGAGDDQITGNITATGNLDASKFRLYYDKPNKLTIGGIHAWFAGVYGVRAANSTTMGKATIEMNGLGLVNGCVIADNVIMDPLAVVTRLLTNMTDAGDYSYGTGIYGVNGNWAEQPITSGGAVFVDGSNN